MRYICKNCNYRFESAYNQEGKSCPYCGKKQVVPEGDAQNLLEDVD